VCICIPADTGGHAIYRSKSQFRQFEFCAKDLRPARNQGEGLFANGSRLFLFAEIRFNVSVPFEKVHNLEAPRDIAKENHISIAGKAADIGAKLRAEAANCNIERGQLMTLRTELPHKTFADSDAAALVGDVSQDR
jgi:hypothetical protein